MTALTEWSPKAGDVVRLKSGGPKMTVSGEKRPDGLVHCYWFANTELRQDAFDPEQLQVAA